ncbi:hypothetical protein HDU90_000353 [Geranomyces variabilis]|nr:hypothetical protein HDU90_000353 [Geranomyces variabilis]
MEVIRSTFQDALLPIIAAAIAEADFIAIDGEFTGLGTSKDMQIDYLDTVEARYHKLKRSATEFQLTQYGVCTFKWNEVAQKYTAKPFNSYVFPLAGRKAFGLEKSFTCQASSLLFLRDCKFDFNKWISQGIPYINQEEEVIARQRIGLYQNADAMIDDAQRPFVTAALTAVHNWLQTSTKKTIEIACSNSLQRKLIHQEVDKKYKDALRTTGHEGYVQITKVTDEERRSKAFDKKNVLNDELDTLIGFRKVIELISASKKPVVGHNMMLDLLHTYQSFFNPLPDTVMAFKFGMHNLFPTIFDTKYLAHSDPKVNPNIPRSVLGDMFDRVRRPPFQHPAIEIDADPAFGGYEASAKDGTPPDSLHEAGYDAYVTGVAFAKMASLATESTGGRISFEHEALQEVRNKMFLMRSDVPWFDFEADEIQPDRTNVFNVYGFPPGTGVADVQKEFSDLGPVSTADFESTRCLLIVRDESRVPDVMAVYGAKYLPGKDEDGEVLMAQRVKGFEYGIETYECYMERKNGGQDNDQNIIEAKRKRRRVLVDEPSSDDAVSPREEEEEELAPRVKRKLAPQAEDTEAWREERAEQKALKRARKKARLSDRFPRRNAGVRVEGDSADSPCRVM